RHRDELSIVRRRVLWLVGHGRDAHPRGQEVASRRLRKRDSEANELRRHEGAIEGRPAITRALGGPSQAWPGPSRGSAQRLNSLALSSRHATRDAPGHQASGHRGRHGEAGARSTMTKAAAIGGSPVAIGSRLRRALDAGRSVITAELAVPATVAHELILERAKGLLRPQIVAMNITDGLRGRPALSPIAAAAILTHADLGVEPIVQVVARSRARNALIADLLGASALGVRNLLCMTGDVPESSADIQDVDVFTLIGLARGFPAGLGTELLGTAEPFCVGAAWSPFAPDPAHEAERLVRKHAAGALFVQTQPVFD